MRINKFVASATGMSRRAADQVIEAGRVLINGQVAPLGSTVSENDIVTLDGRVITPSVNRQVIILNKPRGYVVSRQGQGSHTIYDLLPEKYQTLKPVGRLDKDSSGLLLLTNDGDLAQQLTHPKYVKSKIYHITLDKPLEPLHQQMISDHGIQLEDGPSRLALVRQNDSRRAWQVTMSEGRNRQIRRTFTALGYQVRELHRIQFGNYRLDNLQPGKWDESI